ncbi:MAG: hypothetical protein HY043_04720 [Verrucomicrobia bacterium]|nr:hypothetical protein [Verrucomicrobiota bacterium]
MTNNFCKILPLALFALELTAHSSRAQSTYEPYTFTTLAGNAGYGSADGTGNDARFSWPFGMAVDNAGNVYVADRDNHTIRKVTPAGVVTTLAGLAGSAGSADGTGNNARFNWPFGMAVDSAGNVYVADTGNNTIRKVTPAGIVTTLAGLAGSAGSADGTGNDARFNFPSDVAVDNTGKLYVADSYNFTIRKVTPAGVVTTLAGSTDGRGSADGTGNNAQFNQPQGLALDSAGNVYVADLGNAIRKVTPSGMVTTLAGLDGSYGNVTVDGAGNVYVADRGNHTILKMTPPGVVTTLAGLAGSSGSKDGTGSAARFKYPDGVAVSRAGNVYVADSGNNTIRQIMPTGEVATLAGLAGGRGSADDAGKAARFYLPSGVAVDSTGNVYVADSGNSTIRKVTPAGVVSTLAGLAQFDDGGNALRGSADGTGSVARFDNPIGVAVDTAGNVYVADYNNFTIRRVTPAGLVTTLAGLAGSDGSLDGTGSAARFYFPFGVAVDSAGNVYVTDSGNSTIRKVTPAGVVTTLAGLAGSFGSADGTGSAARFGRDTAGPSGVAVDSAGNIYVADSGNDTIRKVTPDGVVTTLAGLVGELGRADGAGSAARFFSPTGVAVDSAGNLYVLEPLDNLIRKVTPAGVVTTLAGQAGSSGSADGTGSSARFFYPNGVAADIAGNILVADSGNNTIRKGYPTPRILNSGSGFNNGKFGFNLTGPAGKSVVVEASADLVSWLPLWTNTFTFPAALNFSDPQSGGSSNRLYRARLP